MDEKGRTFDHYGRQVFGEDKVQMVGDSSDEDESLEVCSLEAGVFGVEGQDERAEGTEDSNEISLAEVARKKEEERRRNLDSVERCGQEAAKIMMKSRSWGQRLQQLTPPLSPQNSSR